MMDSSLLNTLICFTTTLNVLAKISVYLNYPIKIVAMDPTTDIELTESLKQILYNSSGLSIWHDHREAPKLPRWVCAVEAIRKGFGNIKIPQVCLHAEYQRADLMDTKDVGVSVADNIKNTILAIGLPRNITLLSRYLHCITTYGKVP